MRVLGISAYFHDAAAALVEDGKVIAAAEEERFSRRKHDASFPKHAIAFCLRQGGIRAEDLDHVIFYEKPLRKFERIMVSSLREFPRGMSQFTRALGTWLTKRLWIKAEIADAVGCSPDRVLFSEHHLSHAASAFLCSPFSSAAILTVDGVGEWTTTAIWRGVTDDSGTRIDPIRELHYPHSIGLVYSAITAHLGFEVNEGEYKVMGLAAYGRPRYLDRFEELCRIDGDGALSIDPRYFCYQRHATKSFTPALERLLGPARAPGTSLELPAPEGSEAERAADIAASLQAFTERYLLQLADQAQRLTGERHLAIAGGVALNSVANRRLLESGPFDELYVQPAAGDAGGALGAALYASHVLCGVPRGPTFGSRAGGAVPPEDASRSRPTFGSRAGEAVPPEDASRSRSGCFESAYLGASYAQSEVERFLSDTGIAHRSFADDRALDVEVAERLANGAIGAWHQGRFEWGPRALGARSILADPRPAGVRDRVNRKVKLREPFRPFAPAVLDDEHDRWFVPVPGRVDHSARFMSSVAPATAEARALLPAVVHVDGTSRVQIVSAASAPRFHDLLGAFRERTGLGVLLNTSLNLKDEPMCASPADAYATFVRSELDFLVLERCLVERSPS